uniref:ADP-ribosyl cyclase/cyclic ADP-ribose hydrolase n=1 Tax=Salarias fasciatus TaxID=181472 RepID=A0A672JA84_SALFA
MLQLCPCQTRGQHGTTPHIKHIVMGRCYSYTAFGLLTCSYDCEEIWRRFEEAVVHPTTCNVSVQDYHPMFNLMPQIWPCDKFLFWSKTRPLMHSYAAVLRHFWTLEDTLPGYMFNDLIWCGRDTESGTKAGKKLPKCKYTQSSGKIRVFAEMACGNITVLLNGSVVNAFNRKSMFGSVELDSLNPERVAHVNIKVVTNLEGPHV